MSNIQRIGVLGSGQMGSGIAQTAAQAGLEVWIADQSKELAEKAKHRIQEQLKRQIEKGKLTAPEGDQILNRIHPVPKLENLSDSDFVVEAIAENVELKFSIFKKLDEICPKHCILASNTSS